MGWRVIERLRFDPRTRATPIIMSSSAVEVLEARGPTLLVDDQVHVLAKPRAERAVDAGERHTSCPHGATSCQPGVTASAGSQSDGS